MIRGIAVEADFVWFTTIRGICLLKHFDCEVLRSNKHRRTQKKSRQVAPAILTDPLKTIYASVGVGKRFELSHYARETHMRFDSYHNTVLCPLQY